ncbi:tRNA lysidine(34) synthetase TilS [Amphritea sp. 1_MG-2023]|uniref:tRNA lysidine(34) synthetase TilS n=1 Tax=Amphritea sp. 1_MG-2023 TaxID=3062670 RepID=UPI0026E14EFA|nr:tRNA lysidine(34) synthetase TilS [Amphritea sp. 1_MG-2023]MDO6562619.1 tRNA lysidine(34) synthetase TilS [Amphritea sp. 1_MG-2023]
MPVSICKTTIDIIMKDLQHYFNQQLESHADGVQRWVIGLSGGLDSVVLLHLAANALPAEQLRVITVDHQLQPASSQWAAFCGRLAASLQLPFQQQKVTVDQSASLERAARNARYQAFEQLLQPGDCLLLAHHLNDQAETLLFRMLRGAGVRGMAGMPQTRALGQAVLLRPLLHVSRQQLHQWAEAEQLEWIDDPSNQDLTYDRNYLRHKIMPLLQARWPGFTHRWADMATHMCEAERLHYDLAEIDYAAVRGGDGLSCAALMALSQARRNNLLRFWCRKAGVWLGERQLQAVQSLLLAADDRQPLLTLGKQQLRRYQGTLLLQRAPLELSWQHRSLTAEGIQLPQGCLEVCDSDASVAGLKTLTNVSVRNRQDGDRCRPVGRGGSCSLKKLFQEYKIPAWQRNAWPVCVVGDEIVALPGICICEDWQSEKKGQGFALNWQPIALSDPGDSDTL